MSPAQSKTFQDRVKRAEAILNLGARIDDSNLRRQTNDKLGDILAAMREEEASLRMHPDAELDRFLKTGKLN